MILQELVPRLYRERIAAFHFKKLEKATSRPATTSKQPTHCIADKRSSRTMRAVINPATGTSSDKGATRFAGCLESK
jgi:hypothetical protein